MATEADSDFSDLVAVPLVSVRRAVVARYGSDVGIEVAAEAQAWAWAHRDEVRLSTNRAGLLFRVAQSQARPYHRWKSRYHSVALLPERAVGSGDTDLLDLVAALSKLTASQRAAVVLVHAHGESYDDVASMLGISTAAVTNHVHRGLKRLRAILGAPYVP